MPHKDYMDRQEAAAYLGLSTFWLEANRYHPELPTARLGRKIYYRAADVIAFKERRERAQSHLQTLEELQQASESRQSATPSRAELDRLFGGIEAKKQFVKPPPPVEEEIGAETKIEAAARLMGAKKITRMHDVTQFREVEESGVYHIPGLGIVLHSASGAKTDKG